MTKLVDEFNAKIAKGIIEVESKHCMCDHNSFEKMIERDRYGLWHSVVICRNCGLVQANPTLTSKEFEKFYSSDLYRKIYDSEDFLLNIDNRYKKTNQIFEALRPYLKKFKSKSILEFGCAVDDSELKIFSLHGMPLKK